MNYTQLVQAIKDYTESTETSFGFKPVLGQKVNMAVGKVTVRIG